MKLIRFGAFKNEKPGLVDRAGKRRDCSAHVTDFNADFFASNGLAKLRSLNLESLPEIPADVRWGAPRRRTLEYTEHYGN